MKCNNCKSYGHHVTGSSRCPINREYCYKKRARIARQKKLQGARNGDPNAIGESLSAIDSRLDGIENSRSSTVPTPSAWDRPINIAGSSSRPNGPPVVNPPQAPAQAANPEVNTDGLQEPYNLSSFVTCVSTTNCGDSIFGDA